MDLAEVVIHEMQGDIMSVHLDLLTEPVREPREPAHVHPHREILAFDVTYALWAIAAWSNNAISSGISQTWSDNPASIAGVTRSV